MGIEREETPEPEGEGALAATDEADAQAVIDKKAPAPVDDEALAALGFYRNDSGQIVTKIKVNGEEREMSAEQYKSHMQKDLAGDSKLQSASEIERQLAQRKQQLDQQEEKLRTTMTAQKKPSEEDAKKLRETIKSAFDKVYDGDLESATETLMQVMLERGNATTLTSEEIQQQVEQTVLSTTKKQEQARELQAWNQSVDDGNRELAKNHPEIYKDPNLFDLVNSTTARMLESRDKGDPDYVKLTPKEIIAKAADEVNQWLGNKRGGKEVDAGNTRENRKANLKPVVRGMDSVTRKPPKQELDMSPTAVINRMAKSRATAINRGA
ncbi:MAG: hypothetical protein Q8N34_03705 [Gammaproteobacteria bacterium]|nr:hypothetical protein [Gammaproteobacteria bacterium]